MKSAQQTEGSGNGTEFERSIEILGTISFPWESPLLFPDPAEFLFTWIAKDCVFTHTASTIPKSMYRSDFSVPKVYLTKWRPPPGGVGGSQKLAALRKFGSKLAALRN